MLVSLIEELEWEGSLLSNKGGAEKHLNEKLHTSANLNSYSKTIQHPKNL